MKKPAAKKIMLTTTLALLRRHRACSQDYEKHGYGKLCKHLGGDCPDDKPINLLIVLKNNGVQDMLWCLRATAEPYKDYRQHLFGMYADFAESVLPIYENKYPGDSRVGKTIKAARLGKYDANAADAADAAFAVYTVYAANAADAAANAANAANAADAAANAANAAFAADAANAVYAVYTANAADAAANASKEPLKQAAIIRRYLK